MHCALNEIVKIILKFDIVPILKNNKKSNIRIRCVTMQV